MKLDGSSLFGIMLGCFIFGTIVGSSITRDRYESSPIIKVVSVHDGDTFTVNVVGWPPIIGEKLGVRIKGIDTPEMTDKRQHVKELAVKAKDFVANRIAKANKIELKNMNRDKYFRIDADVIIDGSDLAKELMKNGLAKPYDGGSKPEWN